MRAEQGLLLHTSFNENVRAYARELVFPPAPTAPSEILHGAERMHRRRFGLYAIEGSGTGAGIWVITKGCIGTLSCMHMRVERGSVRACGAVS